MEGLIVGKENAPRRIVLYGVSGIGKSTWAASAPSPVFIATEDGLADLGAARFPVCRSFDEVMERFQQLYEGVHEFATLAVDSLDWLERLIWAEVCKLKSVEHIEEIGYAKGYQFALDYWRRFLAGCDALRDERRMTVILIAHSQIARFEDPERESYDRFLPKLHKSASSLVLEWAQDVLFATYKTYTKKEGEGFRERRIGQGNGERIVRTTERPAHVAKNRLGLPEELPLDWSAYEKFLVAESAPKDLALETSNVTEKTENKKKEKKS